MSIRTQVKLLKDGLEIYDLPVTLRHIAWEIPDVVDFLKDTHRQIQRDYFVMLIPDVPKDYDALKTRSFFGDWVTHYLTGEALLAAEVIKEDVPSTNDFDELKERVAMLEQRQEEMQQEIDVLENKVRGTEYRMEALEDDRK